MLVARREKATANLPLSDLLLQFGRAADAADEIDALVGARVVDAEHGREQVVLQDGDVERSDGVGRVEAAGLGAQAVPLLLEGYMANSCGMDGTFSATARK